MKSATELRAFEGSGTLSFATGEVIKCEFRLILHSSGKIAIQCVTPLTKEFAAIGSRQIDENFIELSNASFTGKTKDGGTVEVRQLSLDITNLDGHGLSPSEKPDPKYIVDTDALDKETREFLSIAFRSIGVPKGAGFSGKWFFTGHLTMLSIQEVTINYSNASQEDVVTASWGLANLEFSGCEQSFLGRAYDDNLTIAADSLKFQIYQLDDYQIKIEHLKASSGTDVTAEVISAIKYSVLENAESVLSKICTLLTLATMNWVTPLYLDVVKDGKTIKTMLLPYKTFPFKNAEYLIDITNRNGCQLRTFVETAFKRYLELEPDFGLRFVIEYYVSAVRQQISEDKFIIAFVALECLASYAPDYARKLGDKLETNAVASVEKRIKQILEKNGKQLPEGIIHQIASEVAYKNVGVKAKMSYLINKFNAKVDLVMLAKIVKLRGQLAHTGVDKEKLASEQYRNLFGIIEIMLLTMFGWKGHKYVNKLSGYRLMPLE